MRKNLGVTLLGIWLIVTALVGLLHLAVPYSGIALHVLALVAGLLIVAGK